MPQVVAPVAAFVTSPLGGLVVSAALGFGSALLQQSLQSQQTPKSSSSVTSAPVGTTLGVQSGGEVPIQFPLGWTATGGMLVYAGTWGESGGTPNAYAVQERVISWLPCPDLPVFWLGPQKCTVDWGASPVTQGYPILEFRVNGVDYAWAHYDDGSQSTASSYMVAKFGSNADYPYSSDMVGRGCAKIRVTLLVNRDLWSSSFPDIVVETTGVRLYDVAKDTSAGGSGSHRWNDPTTWEPSNYPAVQMYNVRRGIFYHPATGDPQWVYGGNNQRALSAYRLPATSWIAAANACKTLVDISDVATEPQFRAGGVVSGDTQPIDALRSLLAACNGRMAEVGGIYELLVGDPGASVYSFSDGDVVITDPQSFEPFPGLDGTFNAVEGTYPEPSEGWADKPAPGRYSAAWEAEDGGRRLVASSSFSMVPYANQVQRVMQAVANDNRQFRVLEFTLPPDAYGVVKPNRVVAWSSNQNGFSDKTFLVVSMRGQRGWNQIVRVREVDSADYDFDPDTQLLPHNVGVLVRQGVPPQLMTGWTAIPSTMVDSDGNGWLPSVEVGWTAHYTDVRAIRIQVREAWDTKRLIFDGAIDYDPASNAHSVVINASFLPNAPYEARGIYLPFSGRVTRWSNQDEDGAEGAWLGVTTPNVSPVPPKSIFLEQLGDDLQNTQAIVTDDFPGSMQEQLDLLRSQLGEVAQAVVTGDETHRKRITTLFAANRNARAAIIRTEEAITSETEARAVAIDEVVASIDDHLADGFLKFESIVGLDGISATITAKVRAVDGTEKSQAGWILQASVESEGDQAFFGVLGTFYVFDSVDGSPIPVFEASGAGGVIFQNGFFRTLQSSALTGTGDHIIVIDGTTGAFSITVP